jgi:sulfite exporter TauE/SafE
MPSLRRQTPQWFKDEFGMFWGAFAWGLDLGQGWTTWIYSAGYYAVIAWAFVLASPLAGALLLTAFGVGRALPVLARGLSLWRLDDAQATLVTQRAGRLLQFTSVAALAFTGGYAVVGGMA